MIGDLILINGEWFVLEEKDGDSIWVSNKSGSEFEFPISVLNHYLEKIKPELEHDFYLETH